MRFTTHPVVTLVVNVGGLVALYLTPLYGWAIQYPPAHVAVQLHFFMAGCLFAWVIAGADPVPHRWSVPRRLILIGAAVAAHAAVAQLVYAGMGAHLAIGLAERRGAGDLMYYGGDLAALLLAVAILGTWRNSATTPMSVAVPRGAEASR
jgi:putative membrane protein